jgi:hypothetical protein
MKPTRSADSLRHRGPQVRLVRPDAPHLEPLGRGRGGQRVRHGAEHHAGELDRQVAAPVEVRQQGGRGQRADLVVHLGAAILEERLQRIELRLARLGEQPQPERLRQR